MYVIRRVNCYQLMLMVASVARQKSSRYLQIWSGKDGSAKEKFCPECPECPDHKRWLWASTV